MELFLLYIWLKLGSIFWFIFASAFVSFIVFLIAAAYEEGEIATLWIKIALALSVCATLLPDKTDVAILVGANYALKAAETPEAQKVMTILRAKANEILDSEIKEQVK
jgi:hypothetical protein